VGVNIYRLAQVAREEVTRIFGVTPLARSRVRHVLRARQTYVYLLREVLHFSWAQMAAVVPLGDHTVWRPMIRALEKQARSEGWWWAVEAAVNATLARVQADLTARHRQTEEG